ncbi:unnamed protein product [Ranitomeya imitator]|uniref:Nuclear nucleic acid-binding protein C1D n=1 Tax=Ranitomeya imitator TaxID=111125 RepID=A0ABN9LBJ3_9NEOB|nr:unnamed protein product [Ranitomeya imitator]
MRDRNSAPTSPYLTMGQRMRWKNASAEPRCAALSLLASEIMAGADTTTEDYPMEIHEYLVAVNDSVSTVDEMLNKMMSVPRSELLQKIDPLEQAKLDLVSAYTLNSLFWVYLTTQGVNPKEHAVKDELVRVIDFH